MSTDQTPGTDVAYLHSSLQERKEYASALAAAGELVPSGFRDKNGAANPAKLLLAFETGSMLGLHPLAALQGVHVIDGKPTISAQLMSGVVRSKGHRLRVTSKGSIEDNTYEVTATLIRRDDPGAPFTATWNIDRARRAELFGKGNWRKYPENMITARAISEVCRMGASDALSGVVYTPEELGAAVDADGEVIDGEIVEEAAESGGSRDTGKRGHASEPRVSTAATAQATPAGGSRPSPSRTVETSGAGRASTPPKRQPVPEPSEEQQAAIREFADAITEADSVNALRTLHHEADQRHLLAYPTWEGVRLNDLFHARKAHLAQRDAEDLPPALDGIEDDGQPV
jgi:hypothetical protein